MKAAGKLHHLNASDRTATGRPRPVVSSGIGVIDQLLPNGGWPRAGLVEIIVEHERMDAVGLLMPLLAQLGQQERWIAMVTPPCQSRSRLFSDPAINPDRVLQVNPHPGRSALWTVESMLHSGDCSTVLAWPGCATELMGRRLQKAATIGRALGILFRPVSRAEKTSGADIRLKVEESDSGQAIYLLDQSGEVAAGTVF